jgi:hypothetical protein
LEAAELAVDSVRAGLAGRIEARGGAGRTETLEGRARVGAGAALGVLMPAALAGRDGNLEVFCPNELVELLRERPGSFGVVAPRTAYV